MGMISRIYQSSESVKPRTLESVHMMILEEFGELARAINRPERCDESAYSEVCDVMISVADLMWLLDKRRALSHGDAFFGLELRDTFDKPFIHDHYLALVELKERVFSISFELSDISNYTECLYTMRECINMLRTLRPELTFNQQRNEIETIIDKKCNKWDRLSQLETTK